ncbi:MAG: hypothetical protein ABSB78_09025 [Bacteroidota bacterium]
MTSEQPQMKSIWYLVGLILISMGVIIFITGLVSPETQKTVLAELRPDIWWGLVMIAGGLTLFLTNRKSST